MRLMWGTLASDPVDGHVDVDLPNGITLPHLPVIASGSGLTDGDRVLLLQEGRRIVVANASGDASVTPVSGSVSMWTRLVVTATATTTTGLPAPDDNELPDALPKDALYPAWLRVSPPIQATLGGVIIRSTVLYQPTRWAPDTTAPPTMTEADTGAWAPYCESAYIQMGSWGFGEATEIVATDANGNPTPWTVTEAGGFAYPTSTIRWHEPASSTHVTILNRTAGSRTFTDTTTHVRAYASPLDVAGGRVEVFTCVRGGTTSVDRSLSAPSGGVTPQVGYYQWWWPLT